ncbi:hypothetical protein HGRIS_007849 [Hohenbuehelia grisea]|uniref:Elongator complex protein 5 n=1 Tax=Hohenbuehelia grisea TaxID=104357 RepID=A0ABR3J653_9AGAR
MASLPLLLTKTTPGQQYLLLQSSSSQSSLPILRNLLGNLGTSTSKQPSSTLLFNLLYEPLVLLDEVQNASNIQVFDYLGNVPGYSEEYVDVRETLLQKVEKVKEGSINVVIDSVDTLCSDIGSDAETYKFLSRLMSIIRARSNTSRLILHLTTPCSLLPLLIQTSFSPSLVQFIAHPPVLLTHLATAYLTPPPPHTPEPKFYSVFLPFSERAYETDRLVYGPDGEGSGGLGEMVVEVLVRGGNEGTVRRRGVERSLEGWSTEKGPCDLFSLESLKGLQKSKSVAEAAPDPTQIASFNLNLTPSQQQSRAQVPLPYAHEGKPLDKPSGPVEAAIFYDPDSADDIDDDDPDEDLDI